MYTNGLFYWEVKQYLKKIFAISWNIMRIEFKNIHMIVHYPFNFQKFIYNYI